MSNGAWCDLNSKGDILKLQDRCPKCNSQKLITFTPKQFQIEGVSIKSKLQKIFKWTQIAWNKFLKPVSKVARPYISMAVSAKTKNPKVGQAMANILKSITGGENLSLTDLHGNSLCLMVM